MVRLPVAASLRTSQAGQARLRCCETPWSGRLLDLPVLGSPSRFDAATRERLGQVWAELLSAGNSRWAGKTGLLFGRPSCLSRSPVWQLRGFSGEAGSSDGAVTVPQPKRDHRARHDDARDQKRDGGCQGFEHCLVSSATDVLNGAEHQEGGPNESVFARRVGCRRSRLARSIADRQAADGNAIQFRSPIAP